MAVQQPLLAPLQGIFQPKAKSAIEYVGLDASCFDFDDVSALCNDDADNRFQLQPCWRRGTTTQLFYLSQYKSIVDSLLPSLKRRGHTFNLLFKERAVTSIVAIDTESSIIIGGITFRLTRLCHHDAIVVNVIMVAILQEQGLAQQGTGSRLVAAATRCAMLAKKPNEQVYLFTQADAGPIAPRFWSKQGLSRSAEAQALLELLVTLDIARTRIYDPAFPMVRRAPETKDWQQWLPLKFPCLLPTCNTVAKSKAGLYAHMRRKHDISSVEATQLQPTADDTSAIVSEASSPVEYDPDVNVSDHDVSDRDLSDHEAQEHPPATAPHTHSCSLQGRTTTQFDSDCDSGIRSACQSPSSCELPFGPENDVLPELTRLPKPVTSKLFSEQAQKESDASNKLASEQDTSTLGPQCSRRTGSQGLQPQAMSTPHSTRMDTTDEEQHHSLNPIDAIEAISSPAQSLPIPQSPRSPLLAKRTQQQRINLRSFVVSTADYSFPSTTRPSFILNFVDARLRDQMSRQQGSTSHQQDVLDWAAKGSVILDTPSEMQAFIVTLISWLKQHDGSLSLEPLVRILCSIPHSSIPPVLLDSLLAAVQPWPTYHRRIVHWQPRPSQRSDTNDAPPAKIAKHTNAVPEACLSSSTLVSERSLKALGCSRSAWQHAIRDHLMKLVRHYLKLYGCPTSCFRRLNSQLYHELIPVAKKIKSSVTPSANASFPDWVVVDVERRARTACQNLS
eukprot:m.137345 g.137345  ORF g.137345 m.137345 type:complete len:731 (-) comp16052_c0_seq2:61-2253(-)